MSKQNIQKKSSNNDDKSIVLTKEQIKVISQEVKQVIVKNEKFIGPLPHPEHFAKYNEIVKGSGDRLIRMAEKDLSHQHFMQKLYGFMDGFTAIGGLIIGAIVAMTSLLGSGYLILQNHDIAGTVLGTGALSSLVGVFVYGTKYNNKN